MKIALACPKKEDTMNPAELLKKSSHGQTLKVIFNRRLRYARNLKNMPFPGAITTEVAEKIWESVKIALFEHDVFRNGFVFYLPELNKLEKILLVERKLITPDMLWGDRPSGVISSRDEKYRVIVNEEDHLRAALFTSGKITSTEDETLKNILEHLELSLGFAISKKYGYLTSCPTNLGSGLRISGLFHLKGHSFLKKLRGMLSVMREKKYQIRGYYGENSRIYGDFFQLSDDLRGMPYSRLENAQNAFNVVEVEELRCRRMLPDSKYWIKFQDEVGRGLGILKYAKLISFEEAISIFSSLLLAIELNVLKEFDALAVGRLITEIQPAHMQFLHGGPLSTVDRDIFRADYIRKELVNNL